MSLEASQPGCVLKPGRAANGVYCDIYSKALSAFENINGIKEEEIGPSDLKM